MLDLAHLDPKAKAQWLREVEADWSRINGLWRLAFWLPTEDYVKEVFDLCTPACRCCHILHDVYEAPEQPAPALSRGLGGKQRDYAAWRDVECQYGTDEARDYGRQWKDGEAMAAGCLFTGEQHGWPDVVGGFMARCHEKGVPRELAISCLMDGDHTGAVPSKHPRLSRTHKAPRRSAYKLRGDEFKEELQNMRPLCYACHRWVTHGPPDFSEDGSYGTLYNLLVASFGDPLTDPGTVKDFEAVGRDWRRYMEKRASDPSQ